MTPAECTTSYVRLILKTMCDVLFKTISAWESTEAAPVAMDTASPWGETDINGTASQQTEGWADFGGFSSAGGEGFANFSTGEEKQESMEEGNGDRKGEPRDFREFLLTYQ